MAFSLQVIDAVENGLHHHHHTGVPAVGVVVHGLAGAKAVFPEVMDVDLHKALFYGSSGDRITQGAAEEFRYYCNNIYSEHIRSFLLCKYS